MSNIVFSKVEKRLVHNLMNLTNKKIKKRGKIFIIFSKIIKNSNMCYINFQLLSSPNDSFKLVEKNFLQMLYCNALKVRYVRLARHMKDIK